MKWEHFFEKGVLLRFVCICGTSNPTCTKACRLRKGKDMMIKKITGGVTAAKGFEAAGVSAGIKYQDRMDMALVYSKAPCVLAGTFTSNQVKAAPVLWDQQIVQLSSSGQAVIVNAGIANACTGQEGMNYCKRTAARAAQALGIPENAVLELEEFYPAVLPAQEPEQTVDGGELGVDRGRGLTALQQAGFPAGCQFLRCWAALQPGRKGADVAEVFFDGGGGALLLAEEAGVGGDVGLCQRAVFHGRVLREK